MSSRLGSHGDLHCQCSLALPVWPLCAVPPLTGKVSLGLWVRQPWQHPLSPRRWCVCVPYPWPHGSSTEGRWPQTRVPVPGNCRVYMRRRLGVQTHASVLCVV